MTKHVKPSQAFYQYFRDQAFDKRDSLKILLATTRNIKQKLLQPRSCDNKIDKIIAINNKLTATLMFNF